MQPTTTTATTEQSAPIPTPAAAQPATAPTAIPAPAEPAAALLPGDPTYGVDVAVPEDTEPLPLPTAEEMAEGIDEWYEEQAATSPLAAACAAGTVRLFRLRGTGTTRRLPWLTGEALEAAEWYRLRVDQGDSVRQVAEACETSKATVRRALATLALMDEITDGLHDDLYAEDVTEILFGADEDGDA